VNADIQITHRKDGKDNGWEKTLNNYSIKTIDKFLKGRTNNLEFIYFSMPMNLDPKDDLVRSCTIQVDQ